jgi:CheY-like chemotaxis protein
MEITDILMPEQEGIETIQALREELPAIGIIAVAGALGGSFLDMARLLGAQAVLTKPVDPDWVLAKAAELVRSRR